LLLISRTTATELVMTFIGFFFPMRKMIDGVLNSGYRTNHVQDMTSSGNDFSLV
jgi:hypothetical protein